MSEKLNMDSAIAAASKEFGIEIRAKSKDERFVIERVKNSQADQSANSVVRIRDKSTDRGYVLSVSVNVIHSDKEHDFGDDEDLEIFMKNITKYLKTANEKFSE